MFEIRIICETADAERITTALNTVFDTGPVRHYPTHLADSDRLYFTADHRPGSAADPWPTSESAYALAPNILSEIAWTAERARDVTLGIELGREFWLRKAACLDRIALEAETDGFHGPACELAATAAARLIAIDGFDLPCHVDEPRGYVREQYAEWAKNQ